MARRAVRLLPVTDFSGGVNLTDDTYQLRDNELTDCLNVTISPQGGVERRKGVRHLATSSSSLDFKNIWQFGDTIVGSIEDDALQVSSGGAFAAKAYPDANFAAGTEHAAAMLSATLADSDALYVQRNAEYTCLKWNGTAVTAMTDTFGAFNEDFTTPTRDHMPKAKYIVSHLGYMFVASTVEDGDEFPNRVRYSHPGEPGDWRELDSIEVGNDDSDFITGLASFRDTLFVFRNKSVWAITGYDTDTFQQQLIVTGTGAVSQLAISVSRYGIAFFDEREGMFLMDSFKPDWLWRKQQKLLTTNVIPDDRRSEVNVCWFRNRLFVGVPWEDDDTGRTFVHDPEVGESSWYIHTYNELPDGMPQGVGPMLDWKPVGTNGKFLTVGGWNNSAAGSRKSVWEVEADGFVLDQYASGGTEYGYHSFFTTSWFDAGTAGVPKRWRRPSFVVDNDIDTTIVAKVYVDYSYLNAKRQFLIATTAATDGGLVWGVGDWGDDTWGGTAPTGEQAIARGSGMGRAFAVSLRFDGPDEQHFGINAIELRYIMQRIR